MPVVSGHTGRNHDEAAARYSRNAWTNMLYNAFGGGSVTSRDALREASPHVREQSLLPVTGAYSATQKQTASLVADELKVENQRLDHGAHPCLVRRPRRDHHLSCVDRMDTGLCQCSHEGGRRRCREQAYPVRGRRVQHRAVLGHHAVKQVEQRHEPAHVVQFPPCDEDQVPSCRAQPSECHKRRLVHSAVMGDSAVVVGRERGEGHADAIPQMRADPNCC